MPESHNRRRRTIFRPIRQHRRALRARLHAVMAETGINPGPAAEEALLDDALGLANPESYPGIDAVLPPPCDDLIRAWFALRLMGVIETEEDRERFGHAFAPCPGLDYHTKQRVGGVSYEDLHRAFRGLEAHRIRQMEAASHSA